MLMMVGWMALLVVIVVGGHCVDGVFVFVCVCVYFVGGGE